MQGWAFTMEDAKLIEPNLSEGISCFGIFDGHCGSEVAKFTAKHFCKELVTNYKFKQCRYEAALAETNLRIDRRLQTESGHKELIRLIQNLSVDSLVVSDHSDSSAGTTALIALLKENTLYISNVGNSHCILSKKGKAIELTTSHLPDLPKETERIHKAGGMIERGKVMGNLNLSRSIGDFEYKSNPDLLPEEQMVTSNPEIRREILDLDCEFLLLATDGVLDSMTPQQCVNFIQQRKANKTAKEIVEELLTECISEDTEVNCGLGCDNMTCILIIFNMLP